jgi:hypothetical protein
VGELEVIIHAGCDDQPDIARPRQIVKRSPEKATFSDQRKKNLLMPVDTR